MRNNNEEGDILNRLFIEIILPISVFILFVFIQNLIKNSYKLDDFIINILYIIFALWIAKGIFSFSKSPNKPFEYKLTPTVIKNKILKIAVKMKTKKILKWVGIVLLVFIILNPGLSQFKEFNGDNSGTKSYNFLIFSLYNYNGSKYLGILMNFFAI